MTNRSLKVTINVLTASLVLLGCAGSQQSNISNQFLERTIPSTVLSNEDYDKKLFEGIIYKVFVDADATGQYQITGIFGQVSIKNSVSNNWIVLKEGSYNPKSTLVYYIQEDNKFDGISTIETAQDRVFRNSFRQYILPNVKEKSLINEARAFKKICLNFAFTETTQYHEMEYACRKIAETANPGQGYHNLRIAETKGCIEKNTMNTFKQRSRNDDFNPAMEKVETCQVIRGVYRTMRDEYDEYISYMQISPQKLSAEPKTENDITLQYPFLIDREQDTGVAYTSDKYNMRNIRFSNLLAIETFGKAGGKNKIIELSDKTKLSELLKMKK